MEYEGLKRAVRACLTDVGRFSEHVVMRPLRPYQLEVAGAIVDSVLEERGLTFAVMMSRQAGKNELSAQLEAYLLNLRIMQGGQIVKASPTFTPQTVNSWLRLSDRLKNVWNAKDYRRRTGYIIELGRARALFFSAGPTASVVGATADLLLEADEAQQIAADKFYRDFAPMAASTNATTVLYGTAWTNDTLLATTIQHLRQQEARDGRRRVFVYDADEVGEYVPAYKRYCDGQVARLGRDHPLIKTQYYLEAIDGSGGLFTAGQKALMRGQHGRRFEPRPGATYALTIDVAGGQEAGDQPPVLDLEATCKRDATAITVVEVEPRPGHLPNYCTVDRKLYLGVRHSSLYDQVLALARHWQAQWVVVDATGIGAGLASFLKKALGEKLIPLVFTTKSKSDLGWAFLAAIETGRYKEYVDDGEGDTGQFWHEVDRCQYEMVPGAGHRMRWGNWDGARYGGLVAEGHDDLLVSAALCVLVDEEEWEVTGTAEIPAYVDPIDEMDGSGW